ncbi:hypothetical protein EVAR_81062_1 [Eumeta japonica]|uniref:Uncharacterized protein n=1 Tax=Eumeta variegata TaxID=151549 RepID=A0A4C1T5K3_EUMVA|nr:hypothetical protein EVAR_81062_1 [Eumeta japonica]
MSLGGGDHPLSGDPHARSPLKTSIERGERNMALLTNCTLNKPFRGRVSLPRRLPRKTAVGGPRAAIAADPDIKVFPGAARALPAAD